MYRNSTTSLKTGSSAFIRIGAVFIRKIFLLALAAAVEPRGQSEVADDQACEARALERTARTVPFFLERQRKMPRMGLHFFFGNETPQTRPLLAKSAAAPLFRRKKAVAGQAERRTGTAFSDENAALSDKR